MQKSPCNTRFGIIRSLLMPEVSPVGTIAQAGYKVRHTKVATKTLQYQRGIGFANTSQYENAKSIFMPSSRSAAVVISQPAQGQNLIVNSNFATGDFSGWNVAETGSGGSPADYGVTNGNDGGSRVPNTGDTYGAYFNPSGGTMDLSQTVDIPAAGSYIVTCAVQPVINDQDTLTIYLGGAPVFSTNFAFGMPYTQISATVPAQAGAQVLDFQFTPGGGPMFFDDAGLVAAAAIESVTCAIPANFNSQSPNNAVLWCNAHISCRPGTNTTLHCRKGSIVIVGRSGQTYTFPVPDSDVVFSLSATTASCGFDGSKWVTECPASGDDEIFLAGCAFPWNPDFAGAKNVTWQGEFTADTPNFHFKWQWGAACYTVDMTQYAALAIKACHNVPCGYNNGDHAGTPENCKSACVGGGTGGGGSNRTGSWSSTGG